MLNEISMTVRPGAATALIGRNGSGKSTLLSILAGLLKLSSGELKWHNQGITAGYAPEAFPGLKLAAEEYLHAMGRIAGLPEREARSRVSSLLQRFGLDAFRSRPMEGYSKGMLQKVNLIQSVLIRPQLLLLDEPMSGLDLPAQDTLIALLQELKQEGTALIFSVHEPQIIEALGDEVIVLQEGQVIRTIRGPEHLRSAPAMNIICTGLPEAAQQAVKSLSGVYEMQPVPERSGTACIGLTADQKMSDICLQQILSAGGSVVEVKPLGGLSDLAEWMDPKKQIGSGSR
ncbi:ABC transporter ATP-binding protein [Paenibacillus piscarius]|uniref:ABC transporter ATP-binding protein n=1 Tax=Paenibacillus piscarius TaxID=1089681 RepID=UPI001EE811F1